MKKSGVIEEVEIYLYTIRLRASYSLVSEPLGYYTTLEEAGEIALREYTKKGYKVEVKHEKVLVDLKIK